MLLHPVQLLLVHLRVGGRRGEVGMGEKGNEKVEEGDEKVDGTPPATLLQLLLVRLPAGGRRREMGGGGRGGREVKGGPRGK